MEKFFQEQERKDILRAKALAEERRKREEAEVQKREEREAAKKAEEEAIERDKLARKDSERLKQENLWEEAGAVTKDEKLATCLHSDNCTKVPQRKKFKCGTCGKKGGMTAFECPFCSSFLCQQCVVKFSERRTKGISIPKPKSQPEDESDPEEVIEEEPEPVTEPPPDIPAEITPVSSFETQHTIPKPHSRNYSAPHKDLEDKYGIIGDQASKVSKTNKKEGHSAQAKMSPIHTPKPSISTSGVKANGTVGHGSTKRPFPVSSGVSSASAYGQLPEQQPQPQPQARVHVTNGYVPKKPQSTTPFQKDRPKTNRFHAKTVSNGMLAATELAPKTNGIPGLEPFPPPAPEHAVPDEVSPDESSVHSDFNPPTAPSSMSHFRKPQVNGFMSQPVFACYICGGTNHMARNCSQPRTCYNCGKTGHLSKDCGTSGAVHERPPAVLSDGPDPRTLIPDFQKAYPEDSMTSAKVCIRGATLARGITEPLLRKAMESFGPISECTIDRKAGVAWAVFVDAAVARNAIAASPVPVAKGAIRISGWSGGR